MSSAISDWTMTVRDRDLEEVGLIIAVPVTHGAL